MLGDIYKLSSAIKRGSKMNYLIHQDHSASHLALPSLSLPIATIPEEDSDANLKAICHLLLEFVDLQLPTLNLQTQICIYYY